MISFEHKCIQVKVPKTAGTSITLALGCMHVIKPHRDILEIRDCLELARKLGQLPAGVSLPDDWFEQFFKFGFVRNPWDRIVSLYHRREGQQMSAQMNFEEFVEWTNYASDTCLHPSRHRNQLDWFTDKEGKLLVDYIGRFETLDEGWREICRRLSVNISLPHTRKNPARQKHYSEYYTNRTRKLVRDKFSVDIEYFDYSFGD